MPNLLQLWKFQDLLDANENKPVLHILEEKYVTVLDPYILAFCSLVYIYCRAFYIPSPFLSLPPFPFFCWGLRISFCALRMESPEKEQLFRSGGLYVTRISEIMQETYALTSRDYLNCRSWTHGFSEVNFDVPMLENGDEVSVTMRDVGGDEVNRAQYWGAAIKDSFCILFVISLSDYTRMDKENAIAKFRRIREILWGYLIDVKNPKIILVCNKQDLFRETLKDVPLHEGCKEFTDLAPQAEGEDFEAYCKRSEEAVLNYFQKIPPSIRSSEEVKKRKEADSNYNLENVRLHGAFVTQATDEALFREVKTKITKIFCDFLMSCIMQSFFNH
jgi:hypothetical protein